MIDGVRELAPGQICVLEFGRLPSYRFRNTGCAPAVYSIKDTVVQLANGLPGGK